MIVADHHITYQSHNRRARTIYNSAPFRNKLHSIDHDSGPVQVPGSPPQVSQGSQRGEHLCDKICAKLELFWIISSGGGRQQRGSQCGAARFHKSLNPFRVTFPNLIQSVSCARSQIMEDARRAAWPRFTCTVCSEVHRGSADNRILQEIEVYLWPIISMHDFK